MITLEHMSACKRGKGTVDILASNQWMNYYIKSREWVLIEKLLSNPNIPSRQKENAICLQNDDTGTNSVMSAIEAGATFEVVKLMLNHAPYIVNSKDSNGWNLLHCACYFNASPEIVQLIVDKATEEIFLKNNSGMTPLHLICRHSKSLDTARIIISEAPVDVCSIPDDDGCNPLHLAIQLNADVDLVELLISNMSQKTYFSKDNKGNDPFHYLCNHTEPEKILRIIAKKSSPSFIIEAIENESEEEDFKILKFAAKELRDDDVLAACAIKKNPYALEFASDNVKASHSIVLQAVEKNGSALQFASNELRNDSTCELSAVKSDPLALEFTSYETRNNHEIVLSALKEDGNALQFAGDELRKNKGIILVAVTTTPSSLRYALGGLDQDKECLLATGLWESNPASDFSKPSIVMSCRMIPNENDYHWTRFGIFMQENEFFAEFKVYHENPWETCSMDQEDNKESWIAPIKSRMEKAKDNGGLVIQVSEWSKSANTHELGPYQKVETELAGEVGVKVFRVLQNHRYGDNDPVPFEHTHVFQVEEKILAWHKTGRKDMAMAKVHLV